jgi:heme/copper-type cytochrome/quinol oxidase subunit 3
VTQAAATEHHEPVENTSTGLNSRKLMMWAFLASDVMFFGVFIATYLVYRGKSLVGPYPSEILDIPLTSVSTFVLLMSSLAMVLALHYVKAGEKNKGTLWILLVVVLGAIFMGFQFYEFREFAHEGLTPRTNIFGTTFFILTGIHGAHVTIGVIWMAFLAYGSHVGSLRSDNSLDLEIAGLYWHFVDIVWIVIFTVIYLISAADGPPAGVGPTIIHG